MRRGGVDYEFTDFFEALYDLVRDAYGVPTGSPILESGDEPVEVDESKYALPWGIIELSGEVRQERGPAAMDISSVFDLYLWNVIKRVPHVNSNKTVRTGISEIAQRIWRDPHLSGTCNNVEPLGASWTGTNRGLQVYGTTGTGIAKGYVGFRFYLIESRVRT